MSVYKRSKLPPIPVGAFATRDIMRERIGIGSTVLLADSDRRVYLDTRENGRGYSSSELLPRYSFVERLVHSETSRSWVVGYGNRKINKKTLDGILSNRCADRAVWLGKHGHRIIGRIGIEMRGDAAFLAEMARRFDVDIEGYPE